MASPTRTTHQQQDSSTRKTRQGRQAKQQDGEQQLTVEHIKSLSTTLKKSLQHQEPWSTTIEYQRQCLRKQYMALIFHSSQTDECSRATAPKRNHAPEALNLLWLDSSYALINIYRTKLSSMDKEIGKTNPVTPKKSVPKNQRMQVDRTHDSPPNVGPVARRKLLQHFRTFLGTEDGFWKSLIHRLINHYHIEAAKGSLKILKIFNDQLELEEPQESNTSDKQDIKHVQSPTFTAEGMLLVHKALICFGDLIRYGELYARTSGQPSSSSGLKSHLRDKTEKNSTVERDWSRCQDCYNQARLLIPTNGNPSNQLAVLSSYIPDILSSAYHYYRALCVKTPFPTARQNLGTTFTKALAKKMEIDHLQSGSGPPKELSKNPVSEIKSRFVALHANLYIRTSDTFAESNAKLCSEFTNHLKDRLLTPELILRMITISMSAVWHARISAANPSPRPSRNEEHMDSRSRPAGAPHSYTTEVNSTVQFLQFTAALLTAAKDALDSIDESIVPGDLSQNIPAVLRRILPAMRIISKWVLSGHFDHINRVKLRLARSKKIKLNSQLGTAEAEFWTKYHQTIELVKKHFPMDKLPTLDECIRLEEDFELVGFLPIARAMKIQQSTSSKSVDQFGFPPSCGACHPNEEHLMRLADLQRDAYQIEAKHFSAQSNLEVEPKDLSEIVNAGLDEIESLKKPTHTINHAGPVPDQGVEAAAKDPVDSTNDLSDEYDNWSDDDDPVELAMRAVVAQQMGNEQGSSNQNMMMLQTLNHSGNVTADDDEDEDDEDVILYLTKPPRGVVDCLLESSGSTAAMSATLQFSSSSSSLDLTPAEPVGGSMRTAADLLASMISTSMATPLNNSHHPCNPALSPLVSAERWNSSSPVAQSVPGLPPLRSSPVVPPPRHGTRMPSVSLPKPAEGSPNFNIWSTLPASSSSSPMEPHLIMASDWPASTAFMGQND
ncbi:hypothetical protein MJO28_010770 [Puccinia striiformis f. sp. tritici]|uniref:DNA/RNA-binding domain-containing protein n=2 Tax=Puccinia striiformis TaxID=27350 RepID=A0A2S4VVS2_9BASI|nr:hypothetical protein MJO28_010770 [Puccinia striiformis f. sp. tritici]POW13611.1 hypothetical protein PSTT_03575 [Puccinia striiformis]